jgi:hypothetical protein
VDIIRSLYSLIYKTNSFNSPEFWSLIILGAYNNELLTLKALKLVVLILIKKDKYDVSETRS